MHVIPKLKCRICNYFQITWESASSQFSRIHLNNIAAKQYFKAFSSIQMMQDNIKGSFHDKSERHIWCYWKYFASESIKNIKAKSFCDVLEISHNGQLRWLFLCFISSICLHAKISINEKISISFLFLQGAFIWLSGMTCMVWTFWVWNKI